MEKDKSRKYSKRSSSRDQDNSDRDDGKSGSSWKKKDRPSIDLIIDYKDVDTLRPFLSEGGRIVPSRVNRLNRKQQKILTSEIKRARQLALVPVSDRHGSHRY